MVLIHVRRVAGNDVEGGGSEDCGRFLQIALADFYPIRDFVQADAPIRHLRHFLLDFQPGEVAALRLRG